MENNYYTPDVSDIRIGYECEVEEITGWEKILIDDEGPEIFYDLHTSIAFTKLKKIRTLYLTKEQIEAEGWKQKEGSDCVFIHHKEELGVAVNFETHWISIGNKDDKTRNLNKRFNGYCSSINEFRFICKLLKIN